MRAEAVTKQNFSCVIDSLINYLRKSSYTELTIINLKRTLKRIEKFMQDNSIPQYSPDAGKQFLSAATQEDTISPSYFSYLKKCIRHLDEYIEKGTIQTFLPRTSKQQIIPAFEASLKKFLAHCKESGNKDNTLAFKEYYLRQFLNTCQIDGITNLTDLTAEEAVKAALSVSNRYAWAVVRAFLLHLCVEGDLPKDFSTVIPHYKAPQKIPSTFTIDELRKLEAAVDRSTVIGSRDYAFILLFTRLGMRVGDVVRLKFDNIDFHTKTISFIQLKTNEPISYPIVPDLEAALMDYICNFRPESTLPYVFLRANAPHYRITAGTVNHRLRLYFDRAEVNIAERKHGPHAIRASLATSMINDKIPYEAVRKVLGHKDPNVIKHYVKIDIENLRRCAIEVPPPSGSFKAFLESGDIQ